MINIGNIILKIAREKELSVHQLAKKLNISPSSFYTNIRNNDMKISRLQQLSELLNHDLFQYFPIRQQTQSTELTALREENQQLRTQNQTLQRENQLVSDIRQLLKSQKNP